MPSPGDGYRAQLFTDAAIESCRRGTWVGRGGRESNFLAVMRWAGLLYDRTDTSNGAMDKLLRHIGHAMRLGHCKFFQSPIHANHAHSSTPTHAATRHFWVLYHPCRC